MSVEPAPILSLLDVGTPGAPRYVLHSGGDYVRPISPDLLKCVFFMAARNKGEYRLKGTGFFFNHELEDYPQHQMRYMVTARHVIEDIRTSGDDGRVHLRVNLKDHGAAFVETMDVHWHFHPDPSVDVAVGQIFYDDRWDHMAFMTESVLTEEAIQACHIGPGSEVFFPGLFVRHAGQGRNLPIIRTGTLAAMPHEKVYTSKYGPMRAYLVEVRSIGGLSGSPVSVETNRLMVGHPGASQVYQSYLIGMIHGHYGTKDIPDSVEGDAIFSAQETRSVNMGIGIVVPAEEIVETLRLTQFVQARKLIAAGIRAQESPMPD